MPITFDTLEELKEFCLAFPLTEKSSLGRRSKSAAAVLEMPAKEAPKRGRRAMKAVEPVIEDAPKKRGRRPASASSPKASSSKASTGGKAETLTAKIQNAIQTYLDKNDSFTANDVYAVLAKRNPDINKQSVITSVLKQMNGTFQHVAVTERPGNGPRPVKLYNAS